MYLAEHMYLIQETYILCIFMINLFLKNDFGQSHFLKSSYIMIVKMGTEKQYSYSYWTFHFTLNFLEVWAKTDYVTLIVW